VLEKLCVTKVWIAIELSRCIFDQFSLLSFCEIGPWRATRDGRKNSGKNKGETFVKHF
jgi:hypothetical protein